MSLSGGPHHHQTPCPRCARIYATWPIRSAMVLCHSGDGAGWGSGAGQVAPYKGGAGTAGARPGGVAASAGHHAVPGMRERELVTHGTAVHSTPAPVARLVVLTITAG